MTAVNVPKIRK